MFHTPPHDCCLQILSTGLKSVLVMAHGLSYIVMYGHALFVLVLLDRARVEYGRCQPRLSSKKDKKRRELGIPI